MMILLARQDAMEGPIQVIYVLQIRIAHPLIVNQAIIAPEEAFVSQVAIMNALGAT